MNVEKSTLQLRSSVSAFHGWRTFYVCSAWNWIAFTLLEARWKESAQKTLLCTFFIRLYFFLRSVIYVNESISFPTPTHSITSTHIFRMAFYMSFHNFYVRHASKRWDQIGENRRRDIIAKKGKGESIIALHDAWTLETVPFLLVFLTRCQRHTRDEWFFGVAWYFHVFFVVVTWECFGSDGAASLFWIIVQWPARHEVKSWKIRAVEVNLSPGFLSIKHND